MKIKISEKKEITLTLGSYGLVRNNTISFRFTQEEGISDIVKRVDHLFHLNMLMSHTLFLIIEDWLDEEAHGYCTNCERVLTPGVPCYCGYKP